MAKKTSSQSKPKTSSDTKPTFPYTTVPNVLRRFLEQVPNKPRPTKVSGELLGSWGFQDSNASTIIKVLKEIGLLDGSGTPSEIYTSFMQPKIGPAVLGASIRNRYSPLFEASHEPFRESEGDLRRLFNIHSGGSEQTLRLQIQTFKTLCEFATFDGIPSSTQGLSDATTTQNATSPTVIPINGGQMGLPTVHIDLHIHLPENKSARDYQAIIEDIAKYIYRIDADANTP